MDFAMVGIEDFYNTGSTATILLIVPEEQWVDSRLGAIGSV